MLTIVEALAAASVETTRGHTFLRADGSERSLSFEELDREARRVGAGLRGLGLAPGERVALVVPDPETFVLAFLGAMTVGLVPVPMYPPPSLSKLDAYAETLSHVLDAAGVSLLVAPHAQLEMLNPLLDALHAEHGARPRAIDAEAIPRADAIVHQVSPDDIALLQFTSGSTSTPKGVTITHGQLAANARAIMDDGLAAHGDRDVGVSWLPLYHDMGLIGFVVAPIFSRVPVVFIPTSTFVRRPTVWLKTIHERRGTITFAPNFAFALATRSIQDRHMEGWDLSCLRVAGCGAEPISAAVMRAFADKFARVGLEANSIMPAYGMAEATLAVTFGQWGQPLHVDRVSSAALKAGRAEPQDTEGSVEVVACGRALSGFSVEVRDEHGAVAPPRTVGEIWVRGPSVAAGYYGDAERTRATFREGWLHTGDLGYAVDGALFVSGRKKDLIIINGRNYLPHDLEALASQVEGVRFGQVVALGMPIGESRAEGLVLVAETARKLDEQPALRAAIGAKINESTGLVVADVVFIQRGTLPKTSSGKVRRSETRSRLEDGTLELALANGDSMRPAAED